MHSSSPHSHPSSLEPSQSSSRPLLQISTGEGAGSGLHLTGLVGSDGSHVLTVFWHSPKSPQVSNMSSTTPLQSSSIPLQRSSPVCHDSSVNLHSVLLQISTLPKQGPC